MKITAEMSIADIVQEYPQTVAVFKQHGLGCLGCAIARFETLADGAAAHGVNLENLLQDLNKALEG